MNDNKRTGTFWACGDWEGRDFPIYISTTNWIDFKISHASTFQDFDARAIKIIDKLITTRLLGLY